MASFRHPSDRDIAAEAPQPTAIGARTAHWRRGFGSLLGNLLAITVLLLGTASSVVTCFGPSRPKDGAGLTPREPVATNARDGAMMQRFEKAWRSAGAAEREPTVWLVDSDEINAASYGAQRFVLFSGLAALPDSQFDAVLAHEFAHDRLRHSQRAAEVADVTNTVGEALGVMAGADRDARVHIRRWTGAFVLPRYSKAQELAADSVGAVLLERQGYADGPRVLQGMLAALRAAAGEAGGGAFDNHPALSDRIAAMERQARYP